jgi:transcriptional regulator with XRE-family HTH domain
MTELTELRKKIHERKKMLKKCVEQKILIRNAINKAGSINALASRLGVSRNTITRWTNGQHVMRSDFMLELLKWVKENR